MTTQTALSAWQHRFEMHTLPENCQFTKAEFPETTDLYLAALTVLPEFPNATAVTAIQFARSLMLSTFFQQGGAEFLEEVQNDNQFLGDFDWSEYKGLEGYDFEEVANALDDYWYGDAVMKSLALEDSLD